MLKYVNIPISNLKIIRAFCNNMSLESGFRSQFIKSIKMLTYIEYCFASINTLKYLFLNSVKLCTTNTVGRQK